MKTKSLLTLVPAVLLACCLCLAAPVLASSSDGNTNLFESAGKKQTNKDFKPAPDKIKTNFGTLKFELDAFPAEETVTKIYDEMDLQRATQAY
jgi:hypothetical protein